MDNEKITQPAHVAYLFMSGCHLDKRNQAYLYQIISRDKDIRKLIRSANIIAFPPILLFFVSFIFAILVGIYTSIQTAESLLSPQTSTTILWSFIIPCIVITMCDIGRRCMRAKKEIISLRALLQILIEKRLPRHPLDIWHLFPISPIDGQIALFAERLLHKRQEKNSAVCSLKYTGEPHASHFLLDSIDIRWVFKKPTHFIKRHLIHRHYRKFLVKYASEQIIATAVHKMNPSSASGGNRRQTSNCVFGLLFASLYLKEFKEKYGTQNEKIYIDLRNIPERDRRKMKSSIQFFTGVYDFIFSDQDTTPDNYSVIMRIERYQIRELERSMPFTRFTFPGMMKRLLITPWKNLCSSISASGPIHIPVKRLFLQPSKDRHNNQLPLDNLAQEDSGIVVLLGGAEQNLSQCHLINRHRWSDCSDHLMHIGFAENQFDYQDRDHYEFLVGAEGFINGNHLGRVIAPDEDKNLKNRNSAEKIQISIDGRPIIILYGYHAISTKIAAGKFFLHNINKPQCKTDKSSEECMFENQPLELLKTYHFELSQSPEFEKLRTFWDEYNPIDNPISDPESTLSQIITRPI